MTLYRVKASTCFGVKVLLLNFAGQQPEKLLPIDLIQKDGLLCEPWTPTIDMVECAVKTDPYILFHLVLLPNRVKTDPYERVDAVFFYRGSKRGDASVNVHNLTNAKYIENPGTINWANRFGAPISAIASLRVFF